MTIRDFSGFSPVVSPSAYVDAAALVVGQVTLGDDVSIWPMTVLRGDVNVISIGAGTNVQDGSVLHVTHEHPDIPGGFALRVGENVTIGHRVVLHGCTVGDYCLIGMGATVMDGAVLEPKVLLGAGSLVPPGKTLTAGHLWLGSPVRKVRALTQKELDWLTYSASHYIELKNKYLRLS
jgi:carbonic anhydrase/acetyltransferase-like protein (isoleucine patch superfamily)